MYFEVANNGAHKTSAAAVLILVSVFGLVVTPFLELGEKGQKGALGGGVHRAVVHAAVIHGARQLRRLRQREGAGGEGDMSSGKKIRKKDPRPAKVKHQAVDGMAAEGPVARLLQAVSYHIRDFMILWIRKKMLGTEFEIQHLHADTACPRTTGLKCLRR